MCIIELKNIDFFMLLYSGWPDEMPHSMIHVESTIILG